MQEESRNKNTLKERIQTLKSIAITIHEEADDHKKRLDSTQSDFERALLNIRKSMGVMRGLRNVRFSHTFYMFLFSIVFFVILYFAFF